MLGELLKKINIIDLIEKIPVVNFVPMLIKMLNEVPERWEKMPDERKQEFFEAVIAAGTRAAADYAKRGKSDTALSA